MLRFLVPSTRMRLVLYCQRRDDNRQKRPALEDLDQPAVMGNKMIEWSIELQRDSPRPILFRVYAARYFRVECGGIHGSSQ